MAYSKEAQELIAILQDKPVAYRPRLARALGSVTAGVWLSQLLYWDKKSTKHEDGWVEKTIKEFEEETALSGREQETAKAICVNAGIVEYKQMGLPAMPCYRIDFDELIDFLVDKGDASRVGIRYLTKAERRRKASPLTDASQAALEPQSVPSQSTENTTESTEDISADALTTSDSSCKVVQPSLFVEPALAPSEKRAQHNADGSGRAVPPRRAAAAEHNDKAKKSPLYKQVFAAVAEVTCTNPIAAAGYVGKCASLLDTIGATPDLIHRVAEWYKKNDWRSTKNNQPLTIDLLPKIWDLAMKDISPSPAATSAPDDINTPGSQAWKVAHGWLPNRPDMGYVPAADKYMHIWTYADEEREALERKEKNAAKSN